MSIAPAIGPTPFIQRLPSLNQYPTDLGPVAPRDPWVSASPALPLPSIAVVGIAGQARAGKDTTAAMMMDLVRDMGFSPVRRAWADPLKEEVAWMLQPRLFKSQAEVLAMMESDKKTFRPLLQWWGTELRRKFFGEDYWLTRMDLFATSKSQPGAVLFIPDVRFRNEADWIKRRGGVLLRVDRPGLADDSHVSENDLKTYRPDWVVDNSGTPEDLRRRCVAIVGRLMDQGFFFGVYGT